jgi:hypothetical protein
MVLTLKAPLPRLLVSALLAAVLVVLMVEGWTALSQVEENLVTEWWEAPAPLPEAALP